MPCRPPFLAAVLLSDSGIDSGKAGVRCSTRAVEVHVVACRRSDSPPVTFSSDSWLCGHEQLHSQTNRP